MNSHRIPLFDGSMRGFWNVGPISYKQRQMVSLAFSSIILGTSVRLTKENKYNSFPFPDPARTMYESYRSLVKLGPEYVDGWVARHTWLLKLARRYIRDEHIDSTDAFDCAIPWPEGLMGSASEEFQPVTPASETFEDDSHDVPSTSNPIRQVNHSDTQSNM